MTEQQNIKRSPIGVELVRALASEGDRIFSTNRARELAPQVGLRAAYVVEALHHLRRTGWIVSLRRGLYAISPAVPGITPVHEFEIAMALVSPAAISHWSAMHHHGMTDQIPRRVFVLTTTNTATPRTRRVSGTDPDRGYEVGGTIYQFIQTKPERYIGIETKWVGESRIDMTDPERTLLDGLARPQYCGDFAEVLHAFETWAGRLRLERIVDYASKFGTAVAKRLGWALEATGVDPNRLQSLVDLPIKGYRKLDPSGPSAGPRNRRWMLQENLPGRIQP
jgi:predicted transcriptional regulator of viral defense system